MKRMIRSFSRLPGMLLALTILVSACAPTSSTAPTSVPETAAAAAPVAAVTPAADLPTLRLALLPVLDALPIYVAEQQGLFAQYGVRVEFIPVASAPERDQIISAGQADGMINELVSTMFYNKEATRVQIVRYARTATADAPVFRILASAKSGITDPQGLKGVKIGISEGTVIEYVTDRLLQGEGFAPEEIQKVAIPKIPDRLALLGSGELAAGVLPDPVSSLAVLQGAVVVIDDTRRPEVSFSTIAFRKAVLDEQPEAVRAFLAAVEEAVALINASVGSTEWNALMGERQLIPAPLAASFTTPAFATSGVPSEAQWQDALTWVQEKGLVTGDLPYADSVTAEFLPK